MLYGPADIERVTSEGTISMKQVMAAGGASPYSLLLLPSS